MKIATQTLFNFLKYHPLQATDSTLKSIWQSFGQHSGVQTTPGQGYRAFL
jgi:hypothetical protein